MKKKKILLTIVASLALGISIVVPAAHNGIGSRAGGGGVAECESGHHHGNHYLGNAPTCVEAGNAEFWACCTCLRQYLTNPGGTFVDQGAYAGDALASTHIAYLAPTGVHSYTNYVVTNPTTDTEGSATAECDHGCGASVTYSILRRPANVKITENVLSWNAVTGAESYKAFLGSTEIYASTALYYTLSEAQLKAFAFDGTNITVRGVTSNAGYYEDPSGTVLTKSGPTPGANTGADFNYDFERTSIKLEANNTFSRFPYGNYSDKNGGVGGWYYIAQDGANNTALKIPAVVWWPGNTTMKKAVTGGAGEIGEYEISFDIKASEASLTLNNGGGGYGTIKGYMWDTGFHGLTVAGTGINFSDAGLVVKDISGISTTAYTNVRLRYTLTAESVDKFNTFNLTYWPEGGIGEDNYIWVDNIQVFKVVDGIVGTTNVDSAGQGDLEGEDFGFTDNLANNRWYNGRTILIEESSTGSEIITEANNRFLKVYCKNNNVAFDLFGNVPEMKKAGIYKFSFKIKAGTTYQKGGIDVIGFKNGGTLFNWFGMSFDEVNTETWTTATGYFYNPGSSDMTYLNVFININNNDGRASSDPNNYLLFDDFSLQRLTYGG
ncbi:MAG: hypothetical protein BWY30_00848 [Tenericutes bacterium ADurb.Bin239]|nr:MAG: hypothetical protein BWY30_00848 [Tenericutes bacterium ADurb.Bin239]